jgi:hypothetical protein
MLWSLLLYVVMMLVFNWDEVSNTIKGNHAITVVTDTIRGSQSPSAGDRSAAPASITEHAGIFGNIITLLKDIGNIAEKILIH